VKRSAAEPRLGIDQDRSVAHTEVGDRPLIAIASSADAQLGNLGASLDADLGFDQVDAVVRRALDLDTSSLCLRRLIRPSDWVLIKPNIVTSRSHKRCSYWHDGIAHPGQVTDLRVMKSLVAYLLEHCHPRRISIAEGGAEWQKTGSPGADPDQTEDGWTVEWPEFGGLSYVGMVATFEASHPGRVDIIDLNLDDICFAPVPDPCDRGIGPLQWVEEEMRPPERFGRNAYVPGTGVLREGYHIPRTILECDKIISVPAMKTHGCGTTLALKNYIGILPNHPSKLVHKHDVHDGDVQKGFIDLVSYHPPDYSVTEGFWSTEGNGPQWGDTILHNVVVAGADPVAADAVASAVMGFDPLDLDYLYYAAQKGFGTLDLDRITTIGKPIAAVSRRFRSAAGRKGIAFAARGSWTWRVQDGNGGPWQVCHSQERYIDLTRHFETPSLERACAEVDVLSDETQPGQLWASADGRLRIELNGQVVVDQQTDTEHQFAEHRVPIELGRGSNLLRVTVERSPGGPAVTGNAPLGFTALLCEEDGHRLPGIEYRVDDQPELAWLHSVNGHQQAAG